MMGHERKRGYKQHLFGSEHAVARIAETWKDIAVIVKLPVDGSGEDRNVRVYIVESPEAFRACE